MALQQLRHLGLYKFFVHANPTIPWNMGWSTMRLPIAPGHKQKMAQMENFMETYVMGEEYVASNGMKMQDYCDPEFVMPMADWIDEYCGIKMKRPNDP